MFDETENIPSAFLEEYADDSGRKFQVEAFNEIEKINNKPQLPIYRLIKDGKEPEVIKTFPKIVDIIFVPSIRQLNDELKFTANSTINKLVSKFVIERVHREDAKSQKYTKVKEAIEELSDYIGDGDYSAFGELKQSLKKHMLDYGNKELDFTLNPPKPDELIKNSFEPYVNVDGNKLKVDSQGMGYQRSLIFSLICNMAELDSSSSNLLNLYLIEEPELFLHPNHQNHFRNRLMQLSRHDNNQIVITSHSPYFLNNIDNYSQVKRVSISDNISNLKEITHDDVSVICAENGTLMTDAFNYNGRMSKEEYEKTVKKISKADVLRYLLWIDPNRANAFLSKKVLLIEGSTEKAFFSFVFNNSAGELYHNDQKSELTIVDINGKFHFYKFANLLNRLGIPTWILHDGDNDKVSEGISHKYLNDYIVQLKRDGVIIDYKRIDPDIEGFLGIEKDPRTPDISFYQKLENRDENFQEAQYQELINFVQNILDYEV